MPETSPLGPEVPVDETLIRAVTVAAWWRLDENPPRVSSFAFKVDSPFSVNVASKMPLPEAIRHLHNTLQSPQGGLVSFNCGFARANSFNAREEIDPQFPANLAHANVYYEGNQRKRDAKRLAEACQTVHHPSFGKRPPG